jgi:hypothetical protein
VTALLGWPLTPRSTAEKGIANCLIVAVALLTFLPWSLLQEVAEPPVGNTNRANGIRRATLIELLVLTRQGTRGATPDPARELWTKVGDGMRG